VLACVGLVGSLGAVWRQSAARARGSASPTTRS